jgi:catechol 2,3-dioxygenase-like lactoylglutathione lyase family enzyme
MAACTIPGVATGHVGLNVSDLERSRRFYTEIFGFQVAAESTHEGRRFTLLGDGQKLILTLWQQSHGRFEARKPGLHHLSFQVADIGQVRDFERRLKERNVRFAYDGIVPHGAGAESGGIFFEDPDGIRLEIFAPTGANESTAPVANGPTCGFF